MVIIINHYFLYQKNQIINYNNILNVRKIS